MVTDGDEDMATFLQQVVSQMHSRYQQMQEKLMSRIDQISTKIDELEKSVDQMTQHNTSSEQADTPSRGLERMETRNYSQKLSRSLMSSPSTRLRTVVLNDP
jgi:heat shock factor-binding protein 1